MTDVFQNILTASFHGSIVILVVMALRLLLKKPRKSICACCGCWQGSGC